MNLPRLVSQKLFSIGEVPLEQLLVQLDLAEASLTEEKTDVREVVDDLVEPLRGEE